MAKKQTKSKKAVKKPTKKVMKKATQKKSVKKAVKKIAKKPIKKAVKKKVVKKPTKAKPKKKPVKKQTIIPRSDYYATGKETIANIELPGINPSDIRVSIENGNLVVRAEKSKEFEEQDKGYYHYERGYSGFYRSFTLPPGTTSNQIKTSFNNGILTIKISKK